MYQMNKNFFSRDAEHIARELLGKILIRNVNGKLLKAKIVDGLLVYVKHIEYSGAESGKSVDVVLAETAESCPEDCVSEGIVKEFYKGIFIRFIRFFGGWGDFVILISKIYFIAYKSLNTSSCNFLYGCR